MTMKKTTFIILIFTVSTIFSCQSEKKREPKNSELAEQTESIKTDEKSSHLSINANEKTETFEKIMIDSLDIVLKGKTTQELQKYKFHTCLGVLLEHQNYAVSIFSLNNNCLNGKNKIVFEKFINYYEQGKANFEIKDELVVTSNFPKKCHSEIRLTLGANQHGKSYIIEFEDNFKDTITRIYRIWEMDLINEKFINVEVPKNFKCQNPNYAEGI